MLKFPEKMRMVEPRNSLPGRNDIMPISGIHAVHGKSMLPPFSENLKQVMFGLGCFWGAERLFWKLSGVYTTAVGYSAGYTPNPTYQEVCSGSTGHNEVVLVVFDPQRISFNDLLKTFWESHNPTQGMQQGNDIGTQYRSGIYFFDSEQKTHAEKSMQHYQSALNKRGLGQITTEIIPAGDFYYAEEYHQQYLHKNPNGYCGLGGCGVDFIYM